MLMTQRRRLDQYLAEQAAAAGAVFRDGVKVAVGSDPERGLTLLVNGEEFRPQVIVGADGANGTVARSLGLGGPITHGVAYEGNAPFEERYRGLAVIELGTIPGGYGWIFPKGDHLNVGVGGWEGEGPKLRDHLAELCRRRGIDASALESVRGHRLPLRRPGFVTARGRALLVGDAAGLVDPLTGDGMYEAFVSARLAIRGCARRPRRACRDGGALRRSACCGARTAGGRIVGGEDRPRPFSAGHVRARPGAARLARRRETRAR